MPDGTPPPAGPMRHRIVLRGGPYAGHTRCDDDPPADYRLAARNNVVHVYRKTLNAGEALYYDFAGTEAP